MFSHDNSFAGITEGNQCNYLDRLRKCGGVEISWDIFWKFTRISNEMAVTIEVLNSLFVTHISEENENPLRKRYPQSIFMSIPAE